jgi:hypothetical protein
MEARGQSSRIASRCLWDVENDNFSEVTYKTVNLKFILVQHSDKEIAIAFGSNLDKDPCDASWGLDDLTFYIK